ncbi:MAG: RNA polymerase sigma factor [Phycisphaerales bacterium]|nr:RNA polymerase sigma factor [Phycisphaerae bacterium]NNF43199.1 RNA polymerase sigma factor [Phycisphaerales bacterium]NNM26852.1 RNA polymerase sigma factor [Phycisphaerales bacterium]
MTDPLDRESFQQAVQRAAQGDEIAWRTIVDAYSRRVFGLLRAQCGNSDLAEEITQSTFCTIVTKIGSYTETGKFESWLFRIAMNRLRDEMRRRKRQARPVEEETLSGLVGPAAEAEAPPSVELAQLRRALEQLSEADRKIVHLRHFGGLSFKQIADVLDQPLGTVLARQHRALKKLKGLMTPDGDAGE